MLPPIPVCKVRTKSCKARIHTIRMAEVRTTALGTVLAS